MALRRRPAPLGRFCEILGVPLAEEERVRPLLTEAPPPPLPPRMEGDGLRIRYLGHACLLLETRGVTLVRGRARLTGERTLAVDGEAYRAKTAIVLATGSEALVPPIPGLAEAEGWTNREGTTSNDVPERLLVLGGGVVGVELGQAWSTLGSHVAIVEGGPRLIAREEEFASRYVADALAAGGVEIHVGSRAIAVERSDVVELTYDV